jgi:hypothetical protein
VPFRELEIRVILLLEDPVMMTTLEMLIFIFPGGRIYKHHWFSTNSEITNLTLRIDKVTLDDPNSIY